MIYEQLNTAWNANDLTPVRGLVTASLRNYLDYWLRQYALEQLQNRLDVAAIQRLELAKVVRDKYFDAITLRVFASGLDYTIAKAAGDRLVGGSPTKPRAYTEYWTFIRASARRGPINATPTCPNCGAGLKISDVGDCAHCNATVENGSFDWTLSKIEQDDSYAG
jgi:predicted lipid-binding transport protein (Tim44 family)